MNLEQLLDQMKLQIPPDRIAAWHVQPARPPRYAEFPSTLSPELGAALTQRGIKQLYTHQRAAWDAATAGQDFVVVTPTASGKTLCYNLPVLDAILKDQSARALYLFPTKALAQDQLAEVHELVTILGADIKTFTYDGDTPGAARRAIRTAGHIVVTNPDMLHTGILPHHTKWVKLFESIKYVVVDEMHQYRGVFGSHLANLLRRLQRICEFYGSRPQFILASATIANPDELASQLIGRPTTLIGDNGAPAGEKHIILYNPPVVNRELGIRKSSVLEARSLAANFLRNGIQTIVFARSRVTTEVLLTYLKEAVAGRPGGADAVRGYRGGYLPMQRREIERGLREGRVLGVVSTNALELGIDIGRLDASVICGYPGSVSSTWQQFGRAGRRSGTSAAVMVADSSPLDQFMMANPEYFFASSPEHGLINPDNIHILLSHLKCAAFELPFADTELFGVATTQQALAFLEEEGILRHAGGKWHWAADNFPAEEISLRSAAPENVVIIDCTQPDHRVIGECDRFAAPMLVHDDAIYIHEGQQYHVDKLDFDELKAYVKKVDVDYYTDANLAVSLKVLDVFRSAGETPVTHNFGEVMITALATIFKKIRLHTHENVGWGKIRLPEDQMHTTAYWLTLGEAATAGLTPGEIQAALVGLSNVLVNVAPVYLLCDPRDLRVVAEVRSPFTDAPTVYLYDQYPGGTGLADKLFDLRGDLAQAALRHIAACPCAGGCPSCVGPVEETGLAIKGAVLQMLTRLTAAAAAD